MLMMRRVALWEAVVGLVAVVATHAPALGQPGGPAEPRLKSHVMTLASPEYAGRRGAGGRKAADYVVARLRELHLQPLFGDSFAQSIPGQGGAGVIGRNVGALLPGSDPSLRDQYVILSAHYDHLGTRGPVVYPGADDNASGVAMLLEVARSVVEGKERPRRSLMFVSFDLEEAGLFGSRYFVEHPPVPLDRVSLFMTADMIGRSLGGVCDPFVFVMGAEHVPALRPWLDDAARGRDVKVGLLGSDLLLLDRSDYGPFRSRKVPYLFFSTGENPVYHTPEDTPDTVNYPKLTAISRVIDEIVHKAAAADRLPGWSPATEPSMAEAMTIREVLRTLLDHRDQLEIGAANGLLMRNALRTLDAIAMRGTITPEERTGVVRVARIVLMTVF
jgi:Peptidase family M28